MNRSISYLLFFSLIFLFCQCSVEKRLYNKGWDVQWNSNKKTSASNRNESTTNEISYRNDTIEKSKTVFVQETSNKDSLSTESFNNRETLVKRTDSVFQKWITKEHVSSSDDNSLITTLPKKIKNELAETKYIDDNVKVWLVLIFLSVVILTIGLLILLESINSEPLIYSMAYFFAGLIITCIGGILLLIGLLGLLINAVSNNERKIKAEKVEKSNEESNKGLDPVENEPNRVLPKTEEQNKKENKNPLIIIGCFLALILTYIIISKT